MNRDDLLQYLTPFSDIGESQPKIAEQGGKLTVKMTRDARPLKIVVDESTGKVQTTWGATSQRNHASIAAMLGSDIFANLKRWADAQVDLLQRDANLAKNLIPINGLTHQSRKIQTIEEVETLLGSATRGESATEILLIDGPAGIGKTNLIEQLALLRARTYKLSPRPLILHVKSRGRVLSNLQDLMAFSLQTIRSPITYDQIPVLTKLGLVIVAIDGFDELGDPNGYELAWAQMGELVTEVRGKGTLILSGRDTFIGRTRLLSDVKALRSGIDIVNSLTLDTPTPSQAKEWLKAYQWTEANFELPSVSVLFEDGSFALRPVFLKLLAEQIKPRLLKEKHERYLTPLLINHIIERESKLFGRPIEAAMERLSIEKFISEFMFEVAREMADSQTEALDVTALKWIAETALGDGYPAEIVGLIKNRAAVIALLMNDERPGHRTFLHSHLLNYFLARVTIDAIARGDIPKFVRRNILGAEFLSVFGDVASEESTSEPSKIPAFINRTITLAHAYNHIDRTIRNAGALLMASLPNFPTNTELVIADFQIDDAVTTGTSASAKAKNITINQLDCRGADLSSLSFESSTIFRIIASASSKFSPSFPAPTMVLLDSGEQISNPEDIASWLAVRGRNVDATISVGISSAKLKRHPTYRLLGQACRMRQYWLRAEDDLYVEKILKNPQWIKLSVALRDNGFLREEQRQASGRSSTFVHIKHRERILAESETDMEIVRLFASLEELAKK